MKPTTPPGTIYINRGRYNWRVHLPGTPSRRNYPLRLDGQHAAIPATKGRSLAVSIAWRIWERASRTTPATSSATLDAICAKFLEWAATYYRRSDDSETREAYNCEVALRILRARHGSQPIDDITYTDILAARDQIVSDGHNRTTINQRVGIWKRFYAWALENRHCTAQTKSEVWAISALKRHRSPAPEGEPVRPVKHLNVKRTLPYLPPILRAMVSVQELCGCRPGEIASMRPRDVEQRRDCWVYRPAIHKTEHKGGVRVICLGPRAQKLLQPYLGGDPGEPVFQPILADRERAAQKRSRRKSPITPSQRARKPKKKPLKAPGEVYDHLTYSRTIAYAIAAARRKNVQIDPWSPNQLRHACGTRIRRRYGADAARAILGHSAGASRITDRYTREAMESEMIKVASRPMLAIG